MVDRLQSYLVTTSLIWRWREIKWMRCPCCRRTQMTLSIILSRRRYRTVASLRIMVQWLQMHVHFILLECLTVIKVMLLLFSVGNHLMCSRTVMVIAARVRQVLSPPLWNTLITILRFLIRQTIYRASTCHILFTYLYAGASWRISKVVMANIIALAEALIHPTLVASAHILIAILIICWMIVHVVKACFRSGGLMCIVSWTITILLRFLLFEITLLSKLAFVVDVIRFLDVKLSFIFRLFDTWLGIDGRERNLFIFGIECEQRYGPVASLVVPPRLVVQFV